MLDAQVRPQNCDTVKPLEINSEVKMNKNDWSSEKDLRYIGNAICGAGKCLAYLMDMCASAEIILHLDYPGDEGWLSLDDFKFDFPKCNKLLTSAMKLLGMANVQTGQGRQLLLSSKFKPEYKKLCNRDQPFTDGKFFGPSLDSPVAFLSTENKVQNQTFQQNRGKSKRWRANYNNNPFFWQHLNCRLQCSNKLWQQPPLPGSKFINKYQAPQLEVYWVSTNTPSRNLHHFSTSTTYNAPF